MTTLTDFVRDAIDELDRWWVRRQAQDCGCGEERCIERDMRGALALRVMNLNRKLIRGLPPLEGPWA